MQGVVTGRGLGGGDRAGRAGLWRRGAAAAALALLVLALPGAAARAQQVAAPANGGLRLLSTSDDGRGWEAVGRLDLGGNGFCTGALIAEDLVLTAAHCLFEKGTGARIAAGEVRFLAGWRNGRAAAYRGVRRAIIHPDYVFAGHDRIDRVANDLAILQLDQPVRLPSIQPFEVGSAVRKGDEVGIVSYAFDRAEAPSLERACRVLGGQAGVVVTSCLVDFGSSGAPVFAFAPDGRAQIVSVVSAKAEMSGSPVALGSELASPLAELRAEVARLTGSAQHRPGEPRETAGGPDGAKFLRP